MTEPRQAVVRFRAPTPPLSENAARGLHWAKTRAATAPWKQAAALAWLALPLAERQTWGQVPVTIHATIPFRDRRRRDAHNYTGTVVKAMVDGLVRARAIPDDAPEWATVQDSTLAVDPTGLVIVTLTERHAP